MTTAVMRYIQALANQVPMLDTLDVVELEILSRFSSVVELNENEVLFQEGDPGDSMAFVADGLLAVTKKTAEGEDKGIAGIGKGQSVGEMSIIDKYPRSATIIAAQPSVIILLDKAGYQKVEQQSPRVALKLMKGLARTLSLRLRQTSNRLSSSV